MMYYWLLHNRKEVMIITLTISGHVVPIYQGLNSNEELTSMNSGNDCYKKVNANVESSSTVW